MVKNKLKKIVDKSAELRNASTPVSVRDQINISNVSTSESVTDSNGVPFIMCGFSMAGAMVCSGSRRDKSGFEDPYITESF